MICKFVDFEPNKASSRESHFLIVCKKVEKLKRKKQLNIKAFFPSTPETRMNSNDHQQQIVCALQQKAAGLEEELILVKRQIAVLTLDCDYIHLTLDDYTAMKDKMTRDMLRTGLTSDEKAKKYLKICAKCDEMKRI